MPPERVWFVDRCLGSRVVPDALRAHGVRVEIHSDHFDDRVRDVDWIPVVAARGWAILTKDDRIRRNPAERDAVLASGAVYVGLTSARMTGLQMAECLLESWSTVCGWLDAHPQQRPVIMTVGRSTVQWFDESRSEWRVTKRKRRP